VVPAAELRRWAKRAMNRIDWPSLFDEIHPQPGASDGDIISLVEAVTRPLSRTEIEQINAEHRHLASHIEELAPKLGVLPVFPWGDPAKWELPHEALPQTYLDFLRWSNGGSFRKGAKWFDTVFRTDEVRGYLLRYDLPEHMPGVLPFAFDGGGTFYVFDMRRPPRSGEYPVMVAHASNLGFGASRQIGTTFIEACQATDDAMSLL